jgi:hypothetical protein
MIIKRNEWYLLLITGFDHTYILFLVEERFICLELDVSFMHVRVKGLGLSDNSVFCAYDRS